jgi:hypothetical protein
MPLRHEGSKVHKEKYLPVTEEEERIGKAIADALI